MLFVENIKLAMTAIRTNKMRSFLTMLGIIIGISSVIAITSIGSSMQAVVDKEFASFGKNAMAVMPNYEMMGDYISYDDMFHKEDLEIIKERLSDTIVYIDPYVRGSSETTVGRVKAKFDLRGCAENMDKLSNMNMIHGRMINRADVASAKPRLVVDSDSAVRLFGREDVVGEIVPLTIEDQLQDYTIVGVYKTEKSIMSGMSTSDTLTGWVPYSVYEQQSDNTMYLYMFSKDGLDQTIAGEKITEFLCKLKDKEPGYYQYQSVQQQQSQMNGMLGTMSIAIGAIAAISLLVGGIGIMNIMLVSVTERTREIGIRKSLGARTNDILLQFLIESMIISAIGGVIGTALGVGIAAAGMSIASVAVQIDPMVIVMAVGFSAVVGMFFGIYPARKAARLDPIEALRYE